MSSTRRHEVTQLLGDLQHGDGGAAARLLPLVYDELRAIAGSFFRRQAPDHTLQPTALVHEAYLRLVRPPGESSDAADGDGQWTGRDHFFAVASKAMRQILINHAKTRQTQKRGGGRHRVTLDERLISRPGQAAGVDVDLLALDEALAKLERLDERQCRVVELRFFGGLTIEQAAAVLDVSPRTIELDWRMARLWLRQQLGLDDRP